MVFLLSSHPTLPHKNIYKCVPTTHRLNKVEVEVIFILKIKY
jgi:hypothetical protein